MRQASVSFTGSRRFTRQSVAPLGSGFIVILAVLFSVLFILSSTLAFVNPAAGPLLRDELDRLSAQQSGIVLLGENVDVDVDEPKVTVRWTVLGCGAEYILSGSPMLHRSKACGIPYMPLQVFLDNSDTASFTYDPESLPTSRKTNQPIVVQSQVQFDNDLILDVHDMHLYPFDTYLVSTSLRVTTSNSSINDLPVSIIGLPVIKYMPSFTILSRSTDILVPVDEDKEPGKHLELEIRRPAHARVYAMLIFGINWVHCHVSMGIVLLAILRRTRASPRQIAKQLIGAFAVLVTIPQLRSVMPDAPGLDGVLIDTIGYFPQMTLAGLSVIALLLLAAKHELDGLPEQFKFMRSQGSRKAAFQRFESAHDTFAGTSSGQAPTSRHGHNRNASIRDYVLERLLQVLDAREGGGGNDRAGGSFGGNLGGSREKMA